MQKIAIKLDLALSRDRARAERQYADACEAYVLYLNRYQEAREEALKLESENSGLQTKIERLKLHMEFIEHYNDDLRSEIAQLKECQAQLYARNRALRNKLGKRPWWQRIF